MYFEFLLLLIADSKSIVQKNKAYSCQRLNLFTILGNDQLDHFFLGAALALAATFLTTFLATTFLATFFTTFLATTFLATFLATLGAAFLAMLAFAKQIEKSRLEFSTQK